MDTRRRLDLHVWKTLKGVTVFLNQMQLVLILKATQSHWLSVAVHFYGTIDASIFYPFVDLFILVKNDFPDSNVRLLTNAFNKHIAVSMGPWHHNKSWCYQIYQAAFSLFRGYSIPWLALYLCINFIRNQCFSFNRFLIFFSPKYFLSFYSPISSNHLHLLTTGRANKIPISLDCTNIGVKEE